MLNRAWFASTGIFGILLAFALGELASAQSVWSGASYPFTKLDSTDPSESENQDRITSNVWMTRGSSGGIYNIAQESFYDSLSPFDTEWATDLNNPGDTIAAANWANLDFAIWIDAYGGPGGGTLPARLIGRNAVVHLISDDIYLDLQFTGWTAQGAGGFSYLRAVNPVPEPATWILLANAAFVVSGLRRRRI
jgi:hypothetical protein